jgi:NADH-quinone oxidoreductase subunit C
MKTPEEIFNSLKEKFDDKIIEFVSNLPVESFIKVAPLSLDEIALYLKDQIGFEFDSLMNLSGIDDASGEKVQNEDGSTSIVGGTLSVFYHLESTKLRHKVVLCTSAPREKPEVTSVEKVWKHADWQEREAYDMFGIIFLGHSDLRRILMPYDWEAGYPLRKDYKNPEFYKGMKVPY